MLLHTELPQRQKKTKKLSINKLVLVFAAAEGSLINCYSLLLLLVIHFSHNTCSAPAVGMNVIRCMLLKLAYWAKHSTSYWFEQTCNNEIFKHLYRKQVNTD